MQRILIPIDFSKQSLRALELAEELLTQIGPKGRATLLCVFENSTLANTLHSFVTLKTLSGKQWREAEQDARAKLLKLATKYLPAHAVQVTSIRAKKSVAEEIVQFAKTHKFTSIVMSTHGRTGVVKLVLGSVAERVVAMSPLPVYVVPCRKGSVSRVIRGNRPVHLVALTDFSAEEEKMFSLLHDNLAIYRDKEVTLQLLHIIEDILVASYHLTLGSDPEEIWREREEITLEKLEEIRDEYFRGKLVLTTAIRQEGTIASTVLEFANNHRASLIIAGKHLRKGVDKMVLGSVAERIVRYADRPVLIVPL